MAMAVCTLRLLRLFLGKRYGLNFILGYYIFDVTHVQGVSLLSCESNGSMILLHP